MTSVYHRNRTPSRTLALIAAVAVVSGAFLLALGCDPRLDEQNPEEGDSEVNEQVDNITVNMSPPNLPADGVSTSEVTVRVTHEGIPVQNATVQLQVTGDSEFEDSGEQTFVALTNGDGRISATLKAGISPGSQVLFVTVGTLGTSRAFNLTGDGPQIQLEVNPPTDFANGTHSISVVATLTSAGKLIAGRDIAFETERGCFDDAASACPIIKTTGPGGQASTSIKVPFLPTGATRESVVVTANVAEEEEFFAPKATTAFTLQNLGSLDISSNCTVPIPAGSSCNLTVTAIAFNGRKIPNYPIQFTAEGGGDVFPSSTPVLTDSRGDATVSVSVPEENCEPSMSVTAVAGGTAVCDFCFGGSTANGLTIFSTFSLAEGPDC